MYLASHVDKETTICSLDAHEIGLFAEHKDASSS